MTKAQRLVHVLVALVGGALLIALVVVLSIPTDSSIVATRFERAQHCIEPPVDTPANRAGLSKLLSGAATADCQQTVSLPNVTPATAIKMTRSSVEPLGIAWYRVQYTVPMNLNAGEQLAVYSPRLMGVAWQARVNDQIVLDNLNDWRMTSYRPLAVRLSSTHFSPGDRLDIVIGIAFQPQVGFSLARISVGPASVVDSRIETRQFLQFVMPVACSVTLLVVGLFFLLFWCSRPAEKTHLLLALSCIVWCICNLHYVLPRRDEALVDAWYSAIMGPSMTWVTWLIYLFAMQFDARLSRTIAGALPSFVLLMSLIALPIWGSFGENFGIVYQGANAAVAAAIVAHIGWLAIRGGSLELRVIGVALALVIVAAAQDVALFAQAINPESIYLLPYSSMLLFGSFLFAMQRRYVRAINDHEQLSSNLAQRLSERESELQAKHARLIELERAQTLAEERQRLMHDMHDGLGSALTTSLAMIERGNFDSDEIKNVLRESVDDLRAVIDSLEPLDGDLISVLATLRFRLGRRMELAGIVLEWDMQDLPSLKWLGPPQALQVIRIVQEILTNVLKHAAASRVRISATCCDSRIEVCIVDNGCGFDVAATSTTHGRGLRHLPKRAAILHGSLLIDSTVGGGTTVRLLLPAAARV